MANDIPSNGMQLVFPSFPSRDDFGGVGVGVGYRCSLCIFIYSWCYSSFWLPLAIFLWPFLFSSVDIATLFVSNDGVNCIVFTFHVNKVDHNTANFEHVCNGSCCPCKVVQAIHFKLPFVPSFFRSIVLSFNQMTSQKVLVIVVKMA